MLWKGLVDVNGIPLCFIASREEIRGQWEEHYEFLEFIQHPEEIYFVNSFFPFDSIPSDDCLLNMKWAMPHLDGCIGQSNRGPDIFRLTWPHKSRILNNIKQKTKDDNISSGKRRKRRRKQRRDLVHLRDNDNKVEGKSESIDVVYVLNKANKKKREDVLSFFYPFPGLPEKKSQRV